MSVNQFKRSYVADLEAKVVQKWVPKNKIKFSKGLEYIMDLVIHFTGFYLYYTDLIPELIFS